MASATALALNHLHDYSRLRNPTSFSSSSNRGDWLVTSLCAARLSSLTPIPGLLAKYKVLRGTMPFEGATTSGEGRELCQSHLGAYVTEGTAAQLQRCLPMRLHRLGYHTLAVHGFDGEMYDRSDWYPKLGFDDIWFHERLESRRPSRLCGAFSGKLRRSRRGVDRRQPATAGRRSLFVHWVTLSSHLPIWGSVEDASRLTAA